MSVPSDSSNSNSNSNSHPTSNTGQDQDHNKQWSTLLTKCLHERVAADRFQRFAALLGNLSNASKKPLDGIPRAAKMAAGHEICTALLRTQLPCASAGGGKVSGAVGFDPLVPTYASRLLLLGLVQGYELLVALFKYSRVGVGATTTANGFAADGEAYEEAGNGAYVSWELEEALLGLLATQYAAHQQGQSEGHGLLKSHAEANKTLTAAADWMSAVVESDHRAMMQNLSADGFQTLGADAVALREALGRLVLALSEHPRVVQVLNPNAPSDSTKKLADTLSAFIPLVSSVSIPLANRLDLFQRSHEVLHHQGPAGFGGSVTNDIDVGELRIGNIPNRPGTNSRASMVVYLDALLNDLPKVRDGILLAYLQLRYKGDVESSIVELITSSFELLAIVSARGDSPDKSFLYRTFLVNKVPVIISSLSQMSFMSPNITLLISQAFSTIQSNGFPTYDSGFGIAALDSSVLIGSRREFLVACVVHGHLGKDNVKSFMGEDSMPPIPAGGKLTKEALLAEYHSNPAKLEQLVNGLESMDGNAGAKTEAVVQILHNLCLSRDTMALKTLCHLLSPKRHAIDTMFLFRSSISILGPLCQVLDEWKYDDDPGEYQPVYEEFSSCLLFLLACIQRFQMSITDLGVQSESSFTTWVADQSLSAQPIKELGEEQTKQLAGWARGLFELESISDDVMSICPPQDFYKLVPTIFTQSLLSRRLEAISAKALESGIELLLEVFLLPCMVFGIRCLANQAWTRGGGSTEMLQFMEKLIRTSSKSGEGSALHNTVLSIARQDLQDILAEFRLNDTAKQKDIDTIVEKLKPHTSYTRSPRNPPTESMVWASDHHASPTLFDFRNSFDALCSWSMPANLMPSLARYSHHQTLFVIETNGATKVIRTLIESLTALADAGIDDVALDIAATLICASDAATHPANPSRSTAALTLRQALQLARDKVPSTIAKEPLAGEMTALLHAQVETQLSSLSDPGDDGPPHAHSHAQIDLQGMQVQVPLDMGLDALPLNPGDMIDMTQSIDMDMGMDMVNLDGMDGMAMDMPPDMPDLGGNMAMGMGMGMNMGMDIGMDMAMDMDMNMDMDMVGMDTLGMDASNDTQSLGFPAGAVTASGAAGTQDNPFPLEIDTSFGGPDGNGNEAVGDGEDGERRMSVEDIWSGLGLDFT